jgi:hypothetical protein
MARYVFKKKDAGIRKLLQSKECLSTMEGFASKIADGGEVNPFIGFDRAKCFIYKKETKK